MRRFLSVCLATLLFGGPALAQSSVGVTGATFDAALADGSTDLGLRLDTAISRHHGLQLGLGLADDTVQPRGSLSGHLYLMPDDGSRYGLFASLTDLDNDPRHYAEIGAELWIGLSDRLSVSGAAAMGAANFEELDWIALRASSDYRLADHLDLSLGAGVTGFDEAAIAAIVADISLRLAYQPGRSAPGFYVQLEADQLFGADAAPARATLSAGLTFTLGRDPVWRDADPLRILFRRGLL